MKKVLGMAFIIGGMVFLSGCTWISSSQKGDELQQEKNMGTLLQPKERAKAPELALKEYTSKNGLVIFTYPTFNFSPDGSTKTRVSIEEKNNLIQVYGDALQNSPLMTIFSQSNIERKDIDAVINTSFGTKNCKAIFDTEKEENVLSGNINGQLSDDKDVCQLLNMRVKYDTSRKTLLVHNTGKSGDFFFDPSIEVDENAHILNDEVFASIRFSPVK